MEEIYRQICPICGKGATVKDSTDFSAVFVFCPQCDRYLIENDIFIDPPREATIPRKEQSCLLWYMNNIRSKQKPQATLPHFHKNDGWGKSSSIESDKRVVIHIDTILNYYPNSFSDRFNKILINLAYLCGDVGGKIEFMNSKGANNDIIAINMFICSQSLNERNQQINDYFSLFEQLGWITCKNKPDSTMKDYVMTAKGWLKVQDLQENNAIAQQCFIAMWFDPCMSNAREKITQAVKHCGFNPIVIDIKEHNNQIVPEIFYEIKQSRFVIADLTGQRNGVYYEAGYAEALGKQVILMCKKKEGEKPHFDVAQKNTIFWSDEEDAYDRLKKRIKATIG